MLPTKPDLGLGATQAYPTPPLLTLMGLESCCCMAEKETGSGHGSPGQLKPPGSSWWGQSMEGHVRVDLTQAEQEDNRRREMLPMPGGGRTESLPATHQAIRWGLGTSRLGHQVTCGQETGDAGPGYLSHQNKRPLHAPGPPPPPQLNSRQQEEAPGRGKWQCSQVPTSITLPDQTSGL